MTGSTDDRPGGANKALAARRERLATELRENLKRRKARERALKAVGPDIRASTDGPKSDNNA